MKFIPVIELEPMKYATVQKASPDYNDKGVVWDTYWKACLQDSELNLSPIKERSWFVPISELDDRSLMIILKREIYECYEEDIDFSPLYGGYILQDQDIWIEPQCCGDISNIADWQEAVKYIGDEQHTLWIGHPWLLVSGDEETMKIQITVEYGDLPNPHVFLFNRSELCKHLEKTKSDMEIFRQRLFFLIKEIDTSLDAEKISKTLVFGESVK